jgi:hypothetical protein
MRKEVSTPSAQVLSGIRGITGWGVRQILR